MKLKDYNIPNKSTLHLVLKKIKGEQLEKYLKSVIKNLKGQKEKLEKTVQNLETE